MFGFPKGKWLHLTGEVDIISVRFHAKCSQDLKKVKVAHTRITERRVPELIPVLGSQPAGDVSHKPGGRLPLLSARPTVTSGFKRTATYCVLNPGSTLTIRLPSHLSEFNTRKIVNMSHF